jgi:phosphoadenosine phosphosulfate reductase
MEITSFKCGDKKMKLDKIISLRQETTALSVEERLKWVADRFPGKIIFASALGAEDQVITDLIARLNLAIPVVTLDTGRLFDETYTLIQKTEARYGIRFRIQFPDRHAVESMVAEHGINLFRNSIEKRKLCCKIRKIEPLRRALSGFTGWICGLRRDQSVTRSDVNSADWDEANQMLKINPIFDWSESQVWEYIARHDVPYNELHDRGYPSIGCASCTRAIKRTEDVRAGRWWWEQPEQKECGLHWVDGKPVRNKTTENL